MKSLIAFKSSQNPQDARVSADGSVDWSGARMTAGDDDAAAIAVAAQVAAGEELVGLTLGDGDPSWAAARGASSTVSVTDARPDPDAFVTAAALAAGVRHVGQVDVAVIGDSVWEPGVPVALGALLGWPVLAGVLSAERDGASLRVIRRVPGGEELVRVTGPAVLAVAARRAEQKVPGMKEVLMARKKPVDKLTLSDLGVQAPSAVRVRGTALPAASTAQVIDGGDPAAAVAQLLSALRTEGVL